MIFGLDNYISTSSFSILNSIILLLGVYRVGLVSQKLLLRNFFSIKRYNDIHYYSFIVGIYIVSYFLYIITILQLTSFLIFKIIAILVYLLGLFSITIFFLNNKTILKLKNLSYQYYIILICLFGLMLISLSPITGADAVGYHVASSIKILNSGSFDTELLPLTSKLASLGELMIVLGFSLKLEQFGALVQFSALFSLIPLFLKKKDSINFLILLIVLLTPITFFLISTPKPQFVQCVATLLIFSFLVNNLADYTKLQFKIIFFVIFLVLAINVLVKYSFIVSSSILYLYCIYIMYKKKLFKEIFCISIIIFIITILPSWIHRYLYFDTTFFNLLLSPLPINIYGYQQLHDLLSPNRFNLISLVAPIKLGGLTNFYGPILFIIFFIKKNSFKKYKEFYFMISVFFLIHIFVGSNLNRFFYEGYLWLMYIIVISELRINKYFSGYQLILKTQILVSILFIYIVSYIHFPGSFNDKLRNRLMTNVANGYSLANWVNKSITQDKIALTASRSLSLYNNETYQIIFSNHIDFKDKRSLRYAKFLKEKKINIIVFFGNKLDFGPFTKCVGSQYKYKKNVGSHVGRNPFNKRKKYDGWIYDFNYKMLPGCLISKP